MEKPPYSESRERAAADADRQAMEEVRASLGEEYEVIRQLGKGAMARVYLAKNRALGVLVAIKVLRQGKAADETARRRFEREARAAASLAEHPNVVAVRHFGRLEPSETPYLVMQYVKGRTMEERLKAEGRLPKEEARQVLAEVTSALALAHGKGIVHRDLRPGNVLWDEEKRRALLTDFGIAAILATGGEEVTRLTKTGQLVGDPRYLSPEQLLDHELTELADMYLLGVLGYELLTGEGPYVARSNTEWITAHLNKEPRNLTELRPDCDPALADMLMRCLSREPNHRPSAATVARAFSDGDQGTAAGLPEPEGLDLVKKNLHWAVAAAGTVGLALFGVAAALADLDFISRKSFEVILIFIVGGFVASLVGAWFHGEKGKQRAPLIEWVLYVLIAVACTVVAVVT
jgi:serine/threonine protein kinase